MSPVKRPLCYPRKPFTGSTIQPQIPVNKKGDGKLAKLIDNVNGTPYAISYGNWRPIAELDTYIKLRRRHATTLDEHVLIQKLINKHDKYYKRSSTIQQKSRVKEPELSNIIHDNHPLVGVNNRDASHEQIINLYEKAGYSKNFINNLSNKFSAYPREVELKNIHLDNVLQKYSGKTTTKKRKLPIRSRFASLMVNKNAIKESDIEDDEENDIKNGVNKNDDEENDTVNEDEE